MIEELHTQIASAQANLARAREAGRPNEVQLHRARLEDLIDMASRHGVDVSPWVDPSLLPKPGETTD